jgi:hypothetical protein
MSGTPTRRVRHNKQARLLAKGDDTRNNNKLAQRVFFLDV